ncbi:DUF1858 domain-containing protein [Mangrovicella endophytica]|uniref:DUF1858 domain-containing protein n=1 Tax=Mangrovicella endophytica TaxID=2066697 RepID=UPI000C9EC365|nr:DUF1858 domain-containing protein [Mangrovicella endophytica]
MTVDELLTCHTVLIPVFIRHRMHCIGCPLARFHSVRDACREHGLALDAFMAAIEAAKPNDGSPARPDAASTVAALEELW